MPHRSFSDRVQNNHKETQVNRNEDIDHKALLRNNDDQKRQENAEGSPVPNMDLPPKNKIKKVIYNYILFGNKELRKVV